jgi:hypothetical protein
VCATAGEGSAAGFFSAFAWLEASPWGGRGRGARACIRGEASLGRAHWPILIE